MGTQLSPAHRVRQLGRSVDHPTDYPSVCAAVGEGEMFCYLWRDDHILTASTIESERDFDLYLARKGKTIALFALTQEHISQFTLAEDAPPTTTRGTIIILLLVGIASAAFCFSLLLGAAALFFFF